MTYTAATAEFGHWKEGGNKEIIIRGELVLRKV